MWFLAEGRVHHVHVTVARTLYLDSEVLLEEGSDLLAPGKSHAHVMFAGWVQMSSSW